MKIVVRPNTDAWIEDGNTTMSLLYDMEDSVKVQEVAEQLVWAAFDLVGRHKIEDILEEYDK